MDSRLKIDRAVDRLFERLGAYYGRDFTYRYDGQDENSVKSVWIFELSGYADNLDAIVWALENLPEKAPNAIQFRNLCRAAPKQNEVLQLPPPAFDPDVVRIVMAGLKPAQDNPLGMRAWAHRLRDRHAAGEMLNHYQIFCYREALAL